MRRKRSVLLALVLAFGLVAAACGEGDQGAQQSPGPEGKECSVDGVKSAATSFTRLGGSEQRLLPQAGSKTVKIGFIGDLSGGNSALVIHARNAAQLAFEQANEEGDLPVRIEFVALDNKDGEPSTAPALAQRLIGDDAVLGVIGGAFSGETKSIGPLFAEAELTQISQSATNPDLTKNGWKTFFRALGNDFVQGGAAGDLVAKALGCTKVALVNDKTEYGAGLAREVERSIKASGGEIVLSEGIEPTTDYTSVIDSIRARDPEVIYYAGYAKESSLLVKQYEEKGGTAIFVSGDGSKDETFLKNGQPASDDSVITCPCIDPNSAEGESAKAFVEAYEEKFDTKPGVYAAEGWDVAQIFIAAIKDGGANVSRASVLEFVTSLEDFEGLTKTFSWTEEHEVGEGGQTTYVYLADGDEFRFVDSVENLAN